MGYLRLVRSAPPLPLPETTCLEAFDAELDYVLETLRRLGVMHKNWSTFDTTRPLRPYLFGVAFRIVCAHRRRRARERPRADLDLEDGAAGPEGSLQSKESVALLLAALERVPLARRAVVIMHELDGVPVADIARTLSISRFGAYARLRKGHKELATAVRRLSNAGGRK
jgi:RNA polymerase sigma-70 factor (ECF subfamily)